MSQRQTLSELYQAIFETTPTSSQLDRAEERLDELNGDLSQLARDWGEQDGSIQDRVRTETLEDVDNDVEEEIFVDAEINEDLSDDEISEFLDQGLYHARLAEAMYANLFGREPGGGLEIHELEDEDGEPLFETTSDILALDAADLPADAATYFDGDIDFPGFQYWVQQLESGDLSHLDFPQSFIAGARGFESDDADLVALNASGLSFFEAGTAAEGVDLSFPPTPTHEIAEGIAHHVTATEDGTVVRVASNVGEDWEVNGLNAEDTAVTISDGAGFGGDMTPKIRGVQELFVRNGETINLENAPDLESLWLRVTDNDITVNNVAAVNALGLYDIGGDVSLDFTTTTRSYDAFIQGFNGELELDGISSSVVGTRLNFSSLDGPDRDINVVNLDAPHLNRIDIAGNTDFDLHVQDGAAITRVTAAGLDADLDVNLTEVGLAQATTLFHGVIIGSAGDTHITLDDAATPAGHLWTRDYGRPGDTLTFDGGGGTNTLTVSAQDLYQFDPGAAWDDENLDRTFAVENLQILEVDGGVGGGTRLLDDDGNPQRVEEAIAADDEVDDIAGFYAGNRILDTGLFGPDLEEVRIDGASQVHVVTRDVLDQIELRDTTEVDLEAGSALETISLRGVTASNIFADGESVESVLVSNSENVFVLADGPSLQHVEVTGSGANTTNDITISGLGTVEVEVETGETDAEGEPETTTEEVNQVVRFTGLTANIEDVNLIARDDTETLEIEVSRNHGDANVTTEGESLNTLDIANKSTINGASLDNINLAGMADDVTLNLDQAASDRFDSLLWVGVTPGDDTTSLAINGTEDAREEVRLNQDNLGGLVNGDGVTIGEHAALYLEGNSGNAGNLSIGGEGALGFRGDGTFNLFHADPGSFEVGRDTDNLSLESINTNAPVRIIGDMDELQVGYAQEFSGDAAVIELDGGGSAITLSDGLTFTDGHARTIEINADSIDEPEEEDAVAPAHYIADLNSEALGPDANAGNTDAINITGSDNVYVGLRIMDDDAGGTHQRLGGLSNDGEISAGDGDLNVVIEDDTGGAAEHTLDMGQFDGLTSLGFNNGGNTDAIRLENWDQSVNARLYSDFSGTLTIDSAVDDLMLELAGHTGNSHVHLDGGVDSLLVNAPNIPDLPEALTDPSVRLWQLHVDETAEITFDNVAAEELIVSRLHDLGADAELNLTASGQVVLTTSPGFVAAADSGINQLADGGNSTLTITAGTPEADEDGNIPRHEVGNINMDEATDDVALTLNGDLLRILGDVNADTATGNVTVTVNGDQVEMQDIDAAAAAGTFTGNFQDANGLQLGHIGADSAETFTAAFGDDVTVSDNIAALAAETFTLSFGDDATANDTIDADDAQTFNASFGDDATVGTINASRDVATDPANVNISFGDSASVDSIHAGGGSVDTEVELTFGEAANIGDGAAGLIADADALTLNLNQDSTVSGLDVTATDVVNINVDGAGTTVSDFAVDGADVTISSSGGGTGTNTVEYDSVAVREHASLTLEGDTALDIGGSGPVPQFEADAVFDMSGLAANVFTGLSMFGGASENLTVQLYGDEVEGADRFIRLGNGQDGNGLVFDFSDMAAGQRVEIDDLAAANYGYQANEVFQFADVQFDLNADNFLVNGVGLDHDKVDDWNDVFALAAENESGDTKIHNAEGDFELLLLGVAADELNQGSFDVI